ncbi:MAG: hypothetical protein CM1200mP39_26580 [Dehalococcoidia bacterium]|nr:MAG: hypothetical protein CM1200mP39_26580 [Dehalococcoidia bacterium]
MVQWNPPRELKIGKNLREASPGISPMIEADDEMEKNSGQISV